jgi:dTDP-glucose 4,6-dehydratase
MRALVTGGAGFIGSALCRRLASLPFCQVLNYDKLTYASSLASLDQVSKLPSYQFVMGDICDANKLQQVYNEFKPDAVFHLAAETHVDRSISGPAGFIETNLTGTYQVLVQARTYWESLSSSAKDKFRLLHISTDEVFGSLGPSGHFREDTAYDPRSPYAASKAGSDHLVRAWHHTYGLPALISNCSNNYGPYQFPEKLIPLAILNALEGKRIPIYGDGSNVRDWLHVDDHVTALCQILSNGKVGETYCIGGRNERSNLEVVYRICDLLDTLRPDATIGPRRNLIEFVSDRLGHDRRYAIDATKLETDLQWRAKQTFETGIAQTVEWYCRRDDWWVPLRLRLEAH